MCSKPGMMESSSLLFYYHACILSTSYHGIKKLHVLLSYGPLKPLVCVSHEHSSGSSTEINSMPLASSCEYIWKAYLNSTVWYSTPVETIVILKKINLSLWIISLCCGKINIFLVAMFLRYPGSGSPVFRFETTVFSCWQRMLREAYLVVMGKNSVPLAWGHTVQPEFCSGCFQLLINKSSTDMALYCKMFSVLWKTLLRRSLLPLSPYCSQNLV